MNSSYLVFRKIILYLKQKCNACVRNSSYPNIDIRMAGQIQCGLNICSYENMIISGPVQNLGKKPFGFI